MLPDSHFIWRCGTGLSATAEWRQGKTENISSSGVLLQGPYPLQPDTAVEFMLALASTTGPRTEISCRGRVVRLVDPMDVQKPLGFAVAMSSTTSSLRLERSVPSCKKPGSNSARHHRLPLQHLPRPGRRHPTSLEHNPRERAVAATVGRRLEIALPRPTRSLLGAGSWKLEAGSCRERPSALR